MTMNDTVKQNKRDKLIPWYFVMFFIGLIIIDGTFIYLATSSSTGVVADKAYETGLAYNDVIELNRKQQELGWNINLEIESNNIIVTAKDKHDSLITEADISAKFFRPTQDGYDFKIKLNEDKNSLGKYSAKFDLPLNGLWDIKLSIEKLDDVYKMSKRITIK